MTWTLLHEDCERQVEDAVVTRCRSHPEETNLVDEHGLTPLHLLCFSNPSIKALSSLLKANPEVLLKKDRHGGCSRMNRHSIFNFSFEIMIMCRSFFPFTHTFSLCMQPLYANYSILIQTYRFM